MSKCIVEYDTETGEILSWDFGMADDHTPGTGELEHTDDTIDLQYAAVDVSSDPHTVVPVENIGLMGHGYVDQRTVEQIGSYYRAAGADALQADDDIFTDGNIPQAVKDFVRASIQMQYLVYVALTGDRIQAVEDDYFPV